MRGTTDWARLARPWLRDLEPYDPGSSRDELRAIHHLDDLAPLNWNEDLFGPPQHVLDAAAAEVGRAALYPERAYADFRLALAGWLRIPEDCVTPAHGAQALISAVASTFIDPGTAVVIPETDLRPLRAGLRGRRSVRHPGAGQRPGLRPPGDRRGGPRRRRPDRVAVRPQQSDRDPDRPRRVGCVPRPAARRLRRRCGRGLHRLLRPGRARAPGGRHPRRPSGDRHPLVLEGVRPGRPAARIRDRRSPGGAALERGAGALQREPGGARRRPGGRRDTRASWSGAGRRSPSPGTRSPPSSRRPGSRPCRRRPTSSWSGSESTTGPCTNGCWPGGSSSASGETVGLPGHIRVTMAPAPLMAAAAREIIAAAGPA